MKVDQSWGLVSAGGFSRSFLIRLPALSERLGPIKATSVQAARIVARSFKASYPTSHYSALEFCQLIWIAVPDSALDKVLQEMAAQMPVHRTMVVICGSARESATLSALKKTGARVATLNVIEESRESLFVGEGQADVLRAVRGLLAHDKRKLIEMRGTAKPLFLAGTHLATHLLLPWIDASVECLRSAGFERSDAIQVSQAFVRRIVKNYGKTGKKAWNVGTAARLQRALDRDLETLAGTDRRLAQLYFEGIRLAAEHFERGQPGAHAKAPEERELPYGADEKLRAISG
jgi:predicted short-subunit dehydrogenase-like oxidoreductase (DUF2520 family)